MAKTRLTIEKSAVIDFIESKASNIAAEGNKGATIPEIIAHNESKNERLEFLQSFIDFVENWEAPTNETIKSE